MNLDIEKIDWRDARNKVRIWQADERAADIFKGQAEWAQATIDKVEVSRLTVRPLCDGKLAGINKSYAVIHKTDWQHLEKPDLPYQFEWLQAKAGRFEIHFSLPEAVRCIGLGERFSDMNLRGARHTLVSTDNPHHSEHADALYKSIPFLILQEDNKFTGIFLDSPAPQRYDLDSEMSGLGKIELFSRRGFSLYVFAATTLANLVQAFTTLTGRSSLPPLWSLGHQQCRWSYPDEETIRGLAKEFRSRKIPCDTLVLDIDYMDDYRVFTYSKERFPDFEKLAKELAEIDIKLVTIVDPGVKKDEGYKIYQEGKKNDLFCLTAGGDLFIERVWPGLSAFPDFLNAKTRAWWGGHLKFYVDNGIAGIWNDMNEPAMFGNQTPLPKPLVEMPEDEYQLFMQNGEDGPIGHFEVRNLYGTLMTMATQEALLKQRPDERPFVLTRAASTGIQRYGAVWLGDNTSYWDHLQKSIPMLLNMGISGVPFAGVDIGGFAGDTTPELLVRWYEVGIFYPFFRNHCALMGRAQEPFAFSPAVEGMVRHLIEWRYKLLPYIQGLFYEHMRTGAPLMRPLSWHFDEPICAEIDDQFMFGADIMVAPVVRPNERSRYVYLPAGRWYRMDDPASAPFTGGQSLRLEFPLGSVPAFVREGAILPIVSSALQSTADYAEGTITFMVYGDKAGGKYFEDDGKSLQYQSGQFAEWQTSYDGSNFVLKAVHSYQGGVRENQAAAHKYQAVAHNGNSVTNLVIES